MHKLFIIYTAFSYRQDSILQRYDLDFIFYLCNTNKIEKNSVVALV